MGHSSTVNWTVLGEHVTKVGSGSTPRGGEAVYQRSGVPLIRSQNVHMNRFEMEGLVYIAPEQDEQMKQTRVHQDDVLLNITGASIGRVCVVPDAICPANVNQHVCIIRSDGSIEPAFLAYYLSTPSFQRFIQDNQSGATRQALTKEAIEDFRIPFPSLPEQQRIAAILDKADRLRRLRRYALDLGETYLQSVFLEMFGDYFRPSHSQTPLGDLVTITGGGTPSRDVARYYTGSIPWLTSKDMKGKYIDDTEEHVTEEAIENSATKLVPAGSILLVVKSKILMHRLPIAITTRPMYHGQDIKSIQCSKKINPHFAVYVLKYNESKILNQARGVNTEGLTLPMIEEVPVPDVPLALQEKFADIMRQYDRLRAQQRESLRQAEMLFGGVVGGGVQSPPLTCAQPVLVLFLGRRGEVNIERNGNWCC